MSDRSIDYDTVSAIYDEVREGDPEMVHHILQGIDLRKLTRVLDVGCGTANNTLLFARASEADVVGLDLSYGMLCKACRKTREVSYVHAPSDRIPFGKSSFGLVFMTEVIHHLSDIPGTLKETHRILKASGQLCIVTQSHAQIDARTTSKLFPDTIAIDKARYPSIQSIEEELQSIGFSDIQTITSTFSPVRLGADFLHTVENKGFSMLHKIPLESFEEGLSKLRSIMEQGTPLDYAAAYSFVWGTKATID